MLAAFKTVCRHMRTKLSVSFCGGDDPQVRGTSGSGQSLVGPVIGGRITFYDGKRKCLTDDVVVLGFGAVCSRWQMPTFRGNILFPSSGLKWRRSTSQLQP
jgi:hypothetical protein